MAYAQGLYLHTLKKLKKKNAKLNQYSFKP